MNINFRHAAVATLAASVAVLAGCGGSGSGETGTTGFLSLAVSDSPIHDAKKVCITFNAIELKSGSNTEVLDLVNDFGGAQTVNLLDFQGDDSTLILGNVEVLAGDYQWMRLDIDAVLGGDGGADENGDSGEDTCDGGGSYMVMTGGSVHNLYVPSSAQNGLKLVGGFTVPLNGAANFTAEWDLMKSITAPAGLAGDVVMKPVIRLVNNVEVGTLTGLVATDLATAISGTEACKPSVFVFNDGVTPNPDGIDDDPNSTAVDPDDAVATAMVAEQQNADGLMTWNYTVGFLLEGNYEAAFTCDGQSFEPVMGKEANITRNQTTTVDFQVPPPE